MKIAAAKEACIALPLKQGQDFNDMLRAGDTAGIVNAFVTAKSFEKCAATKTGKPKKKKDLPGSPIKLKKHEPWGEEVSLPDLLNDIEANMQRYVSMPVSERVACTLWIIHTHNMGAARCTPRLGITSPEMGCGKTTLLHYLACLTDRPFLAMHTSVSVMFQVTDKHHPALLIDEADTFLKDNDALRGIVNAGHSRGAKYTKTVGDEHEPREFDLFAPAAIACIGTLPDTIASRSIPIRMQRKGEDEEKATLDYGLDTTTQDNLARRCARWTLDHGEELKQAEPDPGGLGNRHRDNWIALFAIADLAGGAWPKKARSAAATLTGGMNVKSDGTQLLEDMRNLFEAKNDRDTKVCEYKDKQGKTYVRISSEDTQERLVAQGDGPWATYNYSREINPTQIAQILKQYGIKPKQMRIGTRNLRGYDLTDFEDAFKRYLPPLPPSGDDTASQPSKGNGHGGKQGVTSPPAVTAENGRDTAENGACDGVASPVTPGTFWTEERVEEARLLKQEEDAEKALDRLNAGWPG